MSSPLRVFKRNQIAVTEAIDKRDRHINDGLVAAGFNLDKGPHDAGFFMKYLEQAGGKSHHQLHTHPHPPQPLAKSLRLLPRRWRLFPHRIGCNQTQARP